MTIHRYGGRFASPQYLKRSSLQQKAQIETGGTRIASPKVEREFIILEKLLPPGRFLRLMTYFASLPL